MATANNPNLISLLAGADLSAAQFLLVKISTSKNQVVVAGAGDNAIGVLDSTASAAGQAVAVAIGGKLRAWAGGSFAVGAKLASDANGKLVTATSGAHVIGTATNLGVAGVMTEFVFDKQGILA